MPKSFSKEEDRYILDNCISSGGSSTYREVGQSLDRSKYSIRSRWRKLQLKKVQSSRSSSKGIRVSLIKKVFNTLFRRS